MSSSRSFSRAQVMATLTPQERRWRWRFEELARSSQRASEQPRNPLVVGFTQQTWFGAADLEMQAGTFAHYWMKEL